MWQRTLLHKLGKSIRSTDGKAQMVFGQILDLLFNFEVLCEQLADLAEFAQLFECPVDSRRQVRDQSIVQFQQINVVKLQHPLHTE